MRFHISTATVSTLLLALSPSVQAYATKTFVQWDHDPKSLDQRDPSSAVDDNASALNTTISAGDDDCDGYEDDDSTTNSTISATSLIGLNSTGTDAGDDGIGDCEDDGSATSATDSGGAVAASPTSTDSGTSTPDAGNDNDSDEDGGSSTASSTAVLAAAPSSSSSAVPIGAGLSPTTAPTDNASNGVPDATGSKTASTTSGVDGDAAPTATASPDDEDCGAVSYLSTLLISAENSKQRPLRSTRLSLARKAILGRAETPPAVPTRLLPPLRSRPARILRQRLRPLAPARMVMVVPTTTLPLLHRP